MSNGGGGSRSGFSSRAWSSTSFKPFSLIAFYKHGRPVVSERTPESDRWESGSKSGEKGARDVRACTHLDTFSVALPDLAAFLLVFLGLLLLIFLRVLVLLALLMRGQSRFQVPRKPGVETRIICVLQGSAL